MVQSILMKQQTSIYVGTYVELPKIPLHLQLLCESVIKFVSKVKGAPYIKTFQIDPLT